MENYQNYLKTACKSEGTIKLYTKHINEYMKWYKEKYQRNFKEFHRENIEDYKIYIEISHGKRKTLENTNYKMNARSINVKLSALRSYEEYLIEELKVQKKAVISRKLFAKIEVKIGSANTTTEKSIDKFRNDMLEESSLRNYALVTLLVYSGMRISEALALELQDIDFKKRLIIIRKGKGDKQRELGLNIRILHTLENYNETEKLINPLQANSNYIFPSRTGGKIERSVINRLFNKVSNHTLKIHDLRHWFITNCMNKGIPIQTIANMCGHSNIQTTACYANSDFNTQLKQLDTL